jgi:NTE family protein
MSSSRGPVAFVLGGGGIYGATQIGMLRALIEAGIQPDLIVGTSVGALNGAMVAADPSSAMLARLTELWSSLSASGIFSDSIGSQAVRLARERTHLHSAAPLRRLLHANLPVSRFEDLPVRFECVAASIEQAAAHWFTSGSIEDAVVASCAVPGLFPPAVVHGEHFLDGGLVHSIPVGRAVHLGAREIYVLHVGRLERPLRPPRWPWQVGLVAFEIARRHRFVEEIANLPEGIDLHVLPSGVTDTPLVSIRHRIGAGIAVRVDAAYRAGQAYLSAGAGADDPE